jgi:hypothetical protein
MDMRSPVDFQPIELKRFTSVPLESRFGDDENFRDLKPLTAPSRSLSGGCSSSRSFQQLCVVCQESCLVRVRNACPNKCAGGDMCLPCSRKFWNVWLEDARYMVAPPKCTGCRAPLAMDQWEKTVGGTVFGKFEENLSGVFTMRCPCKFLSCCTRCDPFFYYTSISYII